MTIELPYKYHPRIYQMRAWRYLERNIPSLRAACVWHRRAGKDLMAINLCACKSQERIGLYWHMLPTYKQGRSIVWNGMTREGRRFIDYFPKQLVESENQTEMRLTLKNGSIYQVVGTDNKDLLVGTNPIGVVFSEYSLHDPAAWDFIRPILTENGGWALFIYTARGKNHGFHLIEMAKKNPSWFAEVLVAGDEGTKREDGTAVVSNVAIDEERASGMAEELIQQEFYCSFDAPLLGAYYSVQLSFLMRAHPPRITSVPWDPRLPVDTAWDLGMDDATTIWFSQRYGMEHRFIDYYENSGEGLSHYAKVLDKLPYQYRHHYAPHDINVRELGTGKSRIEVAKSMGIKFTPVKKHEVEDGIEATRTLLPQCWFDETKCERGINALKEYTKDYDEERKVFRNTPLHNWASHGADAMRIYAWGSKLRSKNKGPRQERGLDDHNYLSAR